jgi:hypothetical protein
MSQVDKKNIMLYGTRSVGTVSVEAGIRGEGGPIRPQLLIPLTIQMDIQPDDAMIAVCWLRAQLSTEQNVFPHMAICQPISESLTSGFHAHSSPDRTLDHTVQLRFFLTQAEVEDVEQRRHATNSDVFVLYLGIEPMVAGIKSYNRYGTAASPQETPWDPRFGMFSEVLPFWTASISAPVRIEIEQSTWLRDVLPGLGYDRSRLIELTFPPPLPDHTSAASQFDKAKRALDERRYDDCIQECRGLLNMWEKQLGASSKVRLADMVSEDRGWLESDVRRGLLDSLWKKVGDVANTPHHPEGGVASQAFNARDARLLLLLTTALSEYVEPR